MLLGGSAVAVAVYLWGAAQVGVLPASGLAAVCIAAVACHGRYALRRMPDALELDRERGSAILYFASGKPTAEAVPVRLTHALHWSGLLQHIEFVGANRQRYPVLVLADMLPSETFRILAAWAQRMQCRTPRFC
jgi:hypothetical protein